METKTIVKIIIGIVVVVAAFPFLPKVLNSLKEPDPEKDARNLARIEEAVQAYDEAVGHYPVTLADLVPDYLKRIPKTYNGKAFKYDLIKGVASLPAQPASKKTPSTARGSAVDGLTPIGDAFMGLSVQNELDF